MSFHSSGDRRHIRPLTGQSSWSLNACRIGHIAAFASRLRVGSLTVTTKPSAADLTASCARARASLCDRTNVRYCIECLDHFPRFYPDWDLAIESDFIDHASEFVLAHTAARGHLAQAVTHLQWGELGGKDYLPDGAVARARQVKPDFPRCIHSCFPKKAMSAASASACPLAFASSSRHSGQSWIARERAASLSDPIRPARFFQACGDTRS